MEALRIISQSEPIAAMFIVLVIALLIRGVMGRRMRAEERRQQRQFLDARGIANIRGNTYE